MPDPGPLPGFLALYVEESGIPLPMPGDVFVLYVAARLRLSPLLLAAGWLGLIVTVTLGATNLFFLSRRFAGRLLGTRLGRFCHLTPERVERARSWFRRYGFWALVFGRHIPGFRVPLTMVAATLELPYRTFALSVALSTLLWTGTLFALLLMGFRLVLGH